MNLLECIRTASNIAATLIRIIRNSYILVLGDKRTWRVSFVPHRLCEWSIVWIQRFSTVCLLYICNIIWFQDLFSLLSCILQDLCGQPLFTCYNWGCKLLADWLIWPFCLLICTLYAEKVWLSEHPLLLNYKMLLFYPALNHATYLAVQLFCTFLHPPGGAFAQSAKKRGSWKFRCKEESLKKKSLCCHTLFMCIYPKIIVRWALLSRKQCTKNQISMKYQYSYLYVRIWLLASSSSHICASWEWVSECGWQQIDRVPTSVPRIDRSITPMTSDLCRHVAQPEPSYLTHPRPPAAGRRFHVVARYPATRRVPGHGRLPDQAQRQSESAQATELQPEPTRLPAEPAGLGRSSLHKVGAPTTPSPVTSSWFFCLCVCLSVFVHFVFCLSVLVVVVRCLREFPAVIRGNRISHLNAGAQVHTQPNNAWLLGLKVILTEAQPALCWFSFRGDAQEWVSFVFVHPVLQLSFGEAIKLNSFAL